MNPASPPLAAGVDRLESLHGRVRRAALDDDRTDADAIAALVRSEAPLLSADETASIVDRVRAQISGLGAIDVLLADPEVDDVLVNGPGPVWIERRGALSRTGIDLTARDVGHLVERIVGPLGLRADRRAPLVDARLGDGTRAHIAMPPLAVDGPVVALRRFRTASVPLEAFASAPVVQVLVDAVVRRRNVVVVGGTGAGKTTLLNALCAHLDPGERVITVEDAAELRLPGDHVVRLEARPASPDGLGAVTIRDLLRSALRLRPDRIVIGEVRGGEALDMLQALNTGHDGSLSTCHANGCAQAIRRLETLALTAGVDIPARAVREQIVSAIDLLVHVRRDRGGRRVVTDVRSVRDDPSCADPLEQLLPPTSYELPGPTPGPST